MNDKSITKLTFDELTKCEEPSNESVQKHMESSGKGYYGAREDLREEAYGGKPPTGFQSWGDYWKSI